MDMERYAIIGFIVAFVGLILIILITKYNKIIWFKTKLDKGETVFTSALEKKYHILLRYIDFLNNNAKIQENDFEEYKLLNLKMPFNKLNTKIEEMNNAINKYMDSNEKLLKNETLIQINKELLTVNINVNGCKKYYNDNLLIYNHLINSFPSNIISKIFKFKEKDFLNEDIKNDFKILEDNNEENQKEL